MICKSKALHKSRARTSMPIRIVFKIKLYFDFGVKVIPALLGTQAWCSLFQPWDTERLRGSKRHLWILQRERY